jgi:hypothetical protein
VDTDELGDGLLETDGLTLGLTEKLGEILGDVLVETLGETDRLTLLDGEVDLDIDEL